MVELTSLIRRTGAVMKREGVAGTVSRLIRYARYALGFAPPEMKAYYERRDAEARAFDKDLGLDTGGTVHVFSLTTNSENAAYAGPYIATSPEHFATAMGMLDISVEGATFIDLGSGKGRALFLAAAYPFAAITGVEFAKELHDTSLENIARFGDPRISNTLGDAVEYPYPDGPLVIYMNNPFDRTLMERVVERLTQNVRNNPRPARVVYINYRAPDLFVTAGWTVLADDGTNIALKLDV